MNRDAFGMIFVWIFIMVAGGLIMLLFFMIATSQVEIGKEKLQIQALQQVSGILATQQASPDTYSVVPIPGERLRLTCALVGPEETILNQLEIGGRPRSLENDLVVGQDMETDELILFSKDLRVPFSVGNVLFVSSEGELLRLIPGGVNADATLRAINSSLPEPVRRTGRLDGEGRLIRTVMFNKPSLNPESDFASDSASSVYMHVVGTPDEGMITFYRKSDPTWEAKQVSYSSPEMLLAYIWQGDAMRAECFEKKLMARINQHANLQSQRMKLLYDEAISRGDNVCAVRYVNARLDGLASAAQNNNDVSAAITSVQQQNQGIIGGTSCATIY